MIRGQLRQAQRAYPFGNDGGLAAAPETKFQQASAQIYLIACTLPQTGLEHFCPT